MPVPYVDFPAQFKAEKDELLAAIERTFAGGGFILGPEVEGFEREFATYCGVEHAIGVANGTDAIYLLLRALGVGAGDEVITTANSFVASAGGIVQAGARPVFADVGLDMNVDPAALEAAITPRTRAVLVVHLTGRMARMDAVEAICKKHGLALIEDAAQAAGASWAGRKAGAWGQAASFSLHPLKNLNAAGDAGVITTHDGDLAQRLRQMRNHGLKGRDEVAAWGVNSRLDALQAVILRQRLKNLEQIIEIRRDFATRYRRRLETISPPPEDPQERATYHLFVVQVDRRDELQAHLAAKGIETKVHYPIPIHLQPAARDLGYRPGSLPVTEKLAGRILSLPVHQYLKPEQIEEVSTAIEAFFA